MSLVADRIFHLHSNGVFAGAHGFLQRDAHRCRNVELRVKRLGLLDRRLGLRPKHLAAGSNYGGDVADVQLVFVTVFETGDVEPGPDTIAGLVRRFFERLGVVLTAEEPEIPDECSTAVSRLISVLDSCVVLPGGIFAEGILPANPER